MKVETCGHPSDVLCTACRGPDTRTARQKRIDWLDAAACGHLWYGGEAGKAKYRELMAERARLIAEPDELAAPDVRAVA